MRCSQSSAHWSPWSEDRRAQRVHAEILIRQEFFQAERVPPRIGTWSPRLSPASAALLPGSTVSTKMPKPRSLPPWTVKKSGDSLDGFWRVIWRHFALAAHAMFSRRRWPFIFWQTIQSNTHIDAIRSFWFSKCEHSFIQFCVSFLTDSLWHFHDFINFSQIFEDNKKVYY